MNRIIKMLMMYCLYTALAACSGYKDPRIAEYAGINSTLAATVKERYQDINNSFASFEATNMKSDPERYKPAWDSANHVKENARYLYEYIEQIKADLDSAAARRNTDSLKQMADRTVGNRILNERTVAELKEKTMGVFKYIYARTDCEDHNKYSFIFKAVGEKQLNYSFSARNEPLIAVYARLNRLEADLLAITRASLKGIFNSVYISGCCCIDRYGVIAETPSTLVTLGQPYTAQIYLWKSSDHYNRPSEILVNGKKVLIEEGEGYYKVVPKTPGVKKWKGIVRVKLGDGTTKEYETEEQTYTVVPRPGTRK